MTTTKLKTALSRLILILIGLGFALRIILVLLSWGTNDILSWNAFAKAIDQFGLAYTYNNFPLFNHPPLMGYYSEIAFKLSATLKIPFPYIFKLPMVIADFLSFVLIYKIVGKKYTIRRSQKIVLAFSFSLINILISSYHGNTDSFLAFMILLVAYFMDTKKPFLAGLAFAGTLNIKLITLILLPLLLLSFQKKEAVLKFLIALSIGIIPFLPTLICCSNSFYHNAILYNSNKDNWGIDLFLWEGYRNPRFINLASDTLLFYYPMGRFLIMVVMIVLGYVSRRTKKWSPYELITLGLILFLILTPGFGIQYLVYPAPLLFALNLEWAILYSTLAGIFTTLVYYSFWTGGLPLHSQFYTAYPPPTTLFGLVVWITLIFFAVKLIKKNFSPSHALSKK